MNSLNITIEKYEGDYPGITFIKRGNGPTSRYEILYTEDPSGKKMNYGGIEYLVNFSGPEEPYLLIAIDEDATDPDPNSRDVSGLWLNEQ